MTNSHIGKSMSRKLDHLRLSRTLPDGPIDNGFGDVSLVHAAVSSLNLDQIDIGSSLFTKKLNAPLLINAITGGTNESGIINAALGRVARELGIGIAVGSQKLALDQATLRETYAVARKENPHGLILANVSALSPPKLAAAAVEMIQADGVQLHLNLPQELAMSEGDRHFTGMLDNIAEIVATVDAPVIVKEVGFGISAEIAVQLWSCGVQYLDVGGQGGTNFVTIERHRRGLKAPLALEGWGIPTVVSLAEVSSLGLPLTVVASGGIRNGLDAIKSLALGADFIAIAGPAVKILMGHSEEELLAYFNNFIYELRSLMLLTGSCSLIDLREVPIIFTGKTKDWLEQRGILKRFQARTVYIPFFKDR